MKKINFVFTKEEAIDYYTYMLSSAPSNRLKQVFFIFSLPLLLALTYFFFKLDYLVVKIVFTVLALIWIMIIAPRFWKSYMKINIGEKFLEKNNLTKFDQVNVEIEENKMKVNGVEYELTDKTKIVKTKLVTIFFFEKNVVAVPNRVMAN